MVLANVSDTTLEDGDEDEAKEGISEIIKIRGQWVAVSGDRKKMLESPDGTTWTVAHPGPPVAGLKRDHYVRLTLLKAFYDLPDDDRHALTGAIIQSIQPEYVVALPRPGEKLPARFDAIIDTGWTGPFLGHLADQGYLFIGVPDPRSEGAGRASDHVFKQREAPSEDLPLDLDEWGRI